MIIAVSMAVPVKVLILVWSFDTILDIMSPPGLEPVLPSQDGYSAVKFMTKREGLK